MIQKHNQFNSIQQYNNKVISKAYILQYISNFKLIRH